jgi:hypothetical protein
MAEQRSSIDDVAAVDRIGWMYAGRTVLTSDIAEYVAAYRILNEQKVLMKVEQRIKEIRDDPEFGDAAEAFAMLLDYMGKLMVEVVRGGDHGRSG